MTEEQKRKVESYLNQLSAAELNQTLESQNNFRNWLYRDHYDLYVKVKDSLEELWEISKKIAKGIITGVAVTAGVAVCAVAAPFYILGLMTGIIKD